MNQNPARRAWAAALLLGALAPGCAREPSTTEGSVLELVAIDDTIDPLADAVVLPRGATIGAEGVPVGPGAMRTVHYLRVLDEGKEAPEAGLERLRSWLADVDVDDGRRWLVGSVYDKGAAPSPERVGWRSYLGHESAVVSASDVADAQMGTDTATGAHHVDVRLTTEAAARFREFTRQHTRRRLAILVDGRVESAPVLQTAIDEGRFQVSLSGSETEQRADATRLAAALRASARN